MNRYDRTKPIFLSIEQRANRLIRAMATIMAVAMVASISFAAAAEAESVSCRPLPGDGGNWGGSRTTTAIAFGDVDGDGRMEVAIGRNKGSNMELKILDDAKKCFEELYSDSGRHVTALAFGDIDNDGMAELAVGHNKGKSHRYQLLDDAEHGFQPLIPEGGKGWNKRYGVSALAFGDIDNDGFDELAIGRSGKNKGANMRFQILDDAKRRFKPLLSGGGKHWDKRYGVSALAFGDIDGDRVDDLAIGRHSVEDTNMTYQVLQYKNKKFKELFDRHRTVANGDKLTVKAMSFGNVDNDAAEELAIGWEKNRPLEIIDDKAARYKRMYIDPTKAAITGLAFGNLDGDPYAELLVGSRSTGCTIELSAMG